MRKYWFTSNLYGDNLLHLLALVTRTWLAELFSQHRKPRVPPQRLWNNNIFPERVTLTCRKKRKKEKALQVLQVTKWDGVSGLSERQGVAAKREEKKKTGHIMRWRHCTDLPPIYSTKQTGSCFIWQTPAFPTNKKEEQITLPASLPHRSQFA